MIEVENLQKRFWIRQHHRGLAGALRNLVTRRGREVRAVDDISFRVAAGEMVGYIGPNGAGKSTTVKMLTGILVPSGGRVTVAGLVPWRQRHSLARRIGAVFGQRTQLWWDLPLIESLSLLRHIYHVPAERFAVNLKVLRDLLELDGFLDTPVRQLSLGQRMRGDLAAALLHGPDILYLDEPTIGLDVVAKQRIRDFLRRMNRERDLTVLLTTHDMTDIAQLCPRMLLIDHGRLLYDGSVAAIRDRFGVERTLVVDLAEDEALAGPLDVGPATQVRADGPRRWLRFRREEITAAELISAVSARYRIRDLTIEEPEIEDIVRRIYEEGL
ncbi:MAG: ATP-binding cassette domain-containing protein [Candidatus Tectomicrobia bacterium]|nr:ATP-binding cassette domain-containing protein [Candidatus Tectomicrobia bacterium]